MKDRKTPEGSHKAKTGRRMAKEAKSSKSKPEEAPHGIAAAIDKCIRRVSDIQYSLDNVMPQAAHFRIKEIKKELKFFRNNAATLSQKRIRGADRALAIKNVLSSDSRLDRYSQSELMGILAVGHFLTLFSSFDAFTGELLAAI
jgi:hypothetical protein